MHFALSSNSKIYLKVPEWQRNNQTNLVISDFQMACDGNAEVENVRVGESLLGTRGRIRYTWKETCTKWSPKFKEYQARKQGNNSEIGRREGDTAIWISIGGQNEPDITSDSPKLLMSSYLKNHFLFTIICCSFINWEAWNRPDTQ